MDLAEAVSDRYLYGRIEMDLDALKRDSNVAVYVDGRKLSQAEMKARRFGHCLDLELRALREDMLEGGYKALGL